LKNQPDIKRITGTPVSDIGFCAVDQALKMPQPGGATCIPDRALAGRRRPDFQGEAVKLPPFEPGNPEGKQVSSLPQYQVMRHRQGFSEL